MASPPTPPPREKKHVTEKANGPPAKPDVLQQYRKDKNGQYWFEHIPENDRASWKGMVSSSIPSYFNTMVNSRLVGETYTEENEEYIKAVNNLICKMGFEGEILGLFG